MNIKTKYSFFEKSLNCDGATFLQLRGYGMISLDDILEMIVEGMPNKKGAGIEDILNHSVTLAYVSEAPGLERLVALGFSGGSMFLLKERKFISLGQLSKKIRKAA